MSQVAPIPAGYPALSPGLAIDGAADAIEFYKNVLGAEERMRMPGPHGEIMHAELKIGDSVFMVNDRMPGFDDPKAVGGSPVNMYVYVPDVDNTFRRAVSSGATTSREPKDQFYGDRCGSFVDPWGHHWTVATHVEDVPPAEMDKRMKEAMSAGAAS